MASSSAFWLMKFFSNSVCWLRTTRSWFSSSVCSRATSAASALAWISASTGSISASTSPLRTRLPTSAVTRVTRPATSAPRRGSMTFSTEPTTPSTISTSRAWAWVRVTGVGGGPAGRLASGAFSPPQAPRISAAASAAAVFLCHVIKGKSGKRSGDASSPGPAGSRRVATPLFGARKAPIRCRRDPRTAPGAAPDAGAADRPAPRRRAAGCCSSNSCSCRRHRPT